MAMLQLPMSVINMNNCIVIIACMSFCHPLESATRCGPHPPAPPRYATGKHTVTVENQNYYEVVGPLLYITYCGFIYDVML